MSKADVVKEIERMAKAGYEFTKGCFTTPCYSVSWNELKKQYPDIKTQWLNIAKEMKATTASHLAEKIVSAKDLLNFTHIKVAEAGYEGDEVSWTHALDNNPFYEHLVLALQAKFVILRKEKP